MAFWLPCFVASLVEMVFAARLTFHLQSAQDNVANTLLGSLNGTDMDFSKFPKEMFDRHKAQAVEDTVNTYCLHQEAGKECCLAEFKQLIILLWGNLPEFKESTDEDWQVVFDAFCGHAGEECKPKAVLRTLIEKGVE